MSVKADRVGDSPPRLDMGGVTYGNSDTQVSARISVPALIRSGGAELVIAPGVGGSDFGYTATVAVRPDGSLRKTLAKFDNETSTPVRCKVQGKWSAGKNFIFIKVPHTCVPAVGTGPVYLSARTISFTDDTENDYGPPALHLARS